MAERSWTPAQKNAIEAENGTILVSAAAGSGKTSVLVERIVRKLTDEKNLVPPESLLVVTFTNAAAAEMRSRIAVRIASVTSGKRDRAEENTLLMAKLSEMQVCTMDSFCMNLVKENFHTLGIEADFRMLEEGESSELKRKSAVSVLEKRFSEGSEAFLLLSSMFDSGKNDSRFIESVIKLSDFSMSEPDPEVWLNEVAESFDVTDAGESIWGKCILSELRSDVSYAEELFECALRDIDEDEELAAKYYGFFAANKEKLREFLECFDGYSWDERIDNLKHICSLVAADIPKAPNGYGENPTKKSAKLKRDTAKKALEKAVAYAGIYNEEHIGDMIRLKAAARELADTVTEYNETLLGMKNEMSAYDFSDISHFALSLLTDKEASDNKSLLAKELTEKFSEILIDEYQDTNRAQDELFRLVSKDGNNMFFVGDVKQSIYRFRLASPEIFIEKCEEFPYYDGESVRAKIILGENFRSRKGILDGVNFVFSEIMTRDCGDIEYTDDEKLNFPGTLTDTGTRDVELTVIEPGEDDAYETEARYIAEIIREYISSGERVSEGDKERSCTPSDFAILLRSPSGCAHTYIKKLTEYGIPVSSDVSGSFFETPEIKTVMSYLHVIDNPGRETDLLAVMMSPLAGFSPDEITALKLKYGVRIPLYACVLKAEQDGDMHCTEFIRKLRYFKKLSASVSADVVLREIYSDSAYMYAVETMRDGSARKKNLRLFLEKAEKTAETYTSLGSFLRYMDVLRENGSDMGSGGTGEGVRVMSMHKSKGLEFPFVFIAGTTKGFNTTDMNSNLVINHALGFGMKCREPENIKNYDTLSSLAVKVKGRADLLSEEIRVLYVAMTRAKQHLFIPIALKNAEKHLSENEYLLSNCGRIFPYLVKHARSASEWLLMSFSRHPDGKNICFVNRGPKKPEGSVIVNYIASLPEKTGEETAEEKKLPDEKLLEDIKKRASFRYKYLPVSSALSKHTASSLDDEHFDPAGFGRSVPAFMYAEKMSPSDIGTYTHRFLQFCDFDICKTDPLSESRRLVNEGRLDEIQASAVDMDAIRVFVNSDIVRRYEKADMTFREKQFTMAKSVCEIDSSIPGEFSDEKTVVIGKIDLVFTEGDHAVIVDYKTDNIKDINVLAARYRQQMELYAEALSKSSGLKVSECILYSLKLKESISIFFG
ncbi:MAG: helicase-exonuclease AddAB subunit AddA [Clostridia bacterium]|nr:helicase-exonuclease AddAB subunit AddA [Clostridia bacterium]